jgi:polyhydroxyalkanoate synthesis regulator phasin
MSCPDHPQWYHDREDCPFCLALEIRAVQQAREGEATQLTDDALRRAKARLQELDTMTPEQIRARYRDLDFAAQVPRDMMYLDIGYLCGRIELLERTLIEHKIKLP